MSLEISSYILAFCRASIGFMFLISSISKIRDIKHFQQSIVAFNILSERSSKIAGGLFIWSEAMVAFCMFWGSVLLLPAFCFALFLLLLFSFTLFSVLARKMIVSCNCFGASDKPVTGFDILRNVGAALCALIGGGLLVGTKQVYPSPSILGWVMIGLGATVYILFWLGLGDIVHLFSRKGVSGEIF